MKQIIYTILLLSTIIVIAQPCSGITGTGIQKSKGYTSCYDTVKTTSYLNTVIADTVTVFTMNSTGDITTGGNLTLRDVGTGIYIKEGTNACMGVATLVAGSVVVSTTKVSANSRIVLTVQSLGTITVPVAIAVSARSAGTSFTILSASAIDTSVIGWQIFEPAP